MNPIYRGQYPPKNTDVLWIKDNQIYIYQNGGWKATSGGTADFDAKEGESGYIANKPLSKTVTTEVLEVICLDIFMLQMVVYIKVEAKIIP